MRIVTTFALFALSISQLCADEPGRPNIIFILADDLGYTDLACYGSKFYETPHIDRIAAEGVRFTNGYTCGSNCQPTRAALMSGQYGPRTGVYTVGSIDRFDWRSRPLRPLDNVGSLPLEITTIADTLKSAGYATGMFGKWHLGKGAHHPSKRGFDEAIESSGQHFNFGTDPPTDYPKGKYLADFLTDQAIGFIERHKSEPFFLYLPHFGVHAPHQAKKQLTKHFKNKSPEGGHRDPVYAAMIASLDESVGRILAKLEELDLDENTLVIFSSDNGGVGSYRRAGLEKDGITDNRPLKGGKGMFYEGGIRVPFIFRWPGTIEAGKTNATPIISVDLYRTFAELAGAKPPTNQSLDGESLAGLLTKQVPAPEREAIYWHFPGYLGAGAAGWRTTPVGVVRAGDWKLLQFFEDDRTELYNLKDDIGEKNDLAATEQDKAHELQQMLSAWRTQVGAQMPTVNDSADSDDRPRKRDRQRKKDRRAA
jgi:arylsulfatase A-like enzyme